MASQGPQTTCTALVPYIPSPSSLFAAIRQRVHEATKQLQKIAPNISRDRLVTFIYYGLLGLIGSAAVVLGIFGGGAALVGAVASVPYAEMAGFIATTILRNPALSSLILHIIHDSVCLFAGQLVTVLGVGGMKIKSLTNENSKLNDEKEAEKKCSDEKLKAKADEIKKLEEDKKILTTKVMDLESRFDKLEGQISIWFTGASLPPNAQPPVTPGAANPGVIH